MHQGREYKAYDKRDAYKKNENDSLERTVKVEDNGLTSSLQKVSNSYASVDEVDSAGQTGSMQKLDVVRHPQTSNDLSSAITSSPKVSDTKKENIESSSTAYKGKGEKKFSGRCRLFVANLHNSTTEADLRQLFTPFGEIGEVYVNKEKGFGFIRLDYRHNAEVAKCRLDKTVFKGRVLQVRFATHASAIELHGLDRFASNEYIEQAMSAFGSVERVVVVCNDRGYSKGHAIVEFEWKKSAQKVLDRFKDEMFVLGRLPKPIFAKPFLQQDDEEGIHESEVSKFQGYSIEREFTPRFIPPNSFEYIWAKKWKDLYLEEEEKKAKLEQELQDARFNLENEMEAASRQQDAVRIREELLRRQEELRQIEEDLQRRSAVINLRNEHRIPDTSRKREFDSKKNTPLPSREFQQRQIAFNEDIVRQNEFILRQQAEIEMRRKDILRGPSMPSNMIAIRPDIMRPITIPLGNMQMPSRTVMQGLPHGFMPSPAGRIQLAPNIQRPMQTSLMQGVPQHGSNFAPLPQSLERFDHKKLRRF